MERFVSANDYVARCPDARCSKCNVLLPRNPPGNTLLLETIPVRVCNDLVSGGALCLRCASQSFCMRPSYLSPVKGRTPEKPKTDFAHQTYAGWVGPLSEEEQILIDEANNVWKDFYCKISQSWVLFIRRKLFHWVIIHPENCELLIKWRHNLWALTSLSQYSINHWVKWGK